MPLNHLLLIGSKPNSWYNFSLEVPLKTLVIEGRVVLSYLNLTKRIISWLIIWVKVFKNGPSKISGRQTLTNLK